MLGAVLLLAGIVAAVFAVRVEAVWVFAAAVLSQLGLIALTPRLVRGAAGLAARLPLPFRLAARDASRHRGRTASAVAAVMTATAAFTAAGVAVSSDVADRRDAFQATIPAGTMGVAGWGLDDGRWAEVAEAVRERLPGVPLIEAAEPRDAEGAVVDLHVVSDPGAPFLSGGEVHVQGVSNTPPIGDARLLRLVQGRSDPVAAEAFAAGKAVVFDPALVRDGRLKLRVISAEDTGPWEITVPAVAAAAADPGTRWWCCPPPPSSPPG
nr:hypothetical protein GCM10020093_056090 [Planobispora longispora]